MPSITGTVFISDADDAPETDVIVRAYDIDLVNKQLLGKVTLQAPFRNTSQAFQIRYSSRRYQSAEGGGTADIQVQASTLDGLLAGETQIIFNAPDEVTDIRLELRPVENPASEFERLVASLTPLMEGVLPADLTSGQMNFLARDSEERRSRIIIWNEAAILTRDTGILTEAGYGWFRRLGHPHTLAGLLEQDEGLLRDTLTGAIRSNIIPDISEDLDSIFVQLGNQRFEQGILVAQRFTVQLINEADVEPLTNYLIERINTESQVIAQDITDALGQASFSITLSGSSDSGETPSSLNIQLQVRNLEGETVTEPSNITFTVVRDETDVQLIRVSLLEPEDDTAPIRTVASSNLAQLLERQGIQTIDQLRRAGGPRRILDLNPEEADFQRLEAHVQLSVLSKDAELNTMLIDRGYSSLGKIAEQPRAKFVSEMAPQIGDYQAALLKHKAEAQYKVLTNITTGLRTGIANGHISAGELAESGIDQATVSGSSSCSCRDCEAAVSPLAYLADLLEYTVDHVKDGDDDISLRWLERNFHQPFGDLPTDCDAIDRRVRQVRLCIEMLWRLHNANQTDDEVEDLAERADVYRGKAYEALLNQLGASREELRRVIGANNPEELNKLAQQIGISSVHLSELFIDIEDNPEELTEPWLEQVFGLVDTRRDPFAEGNTPQLAIWQEEYLQNLWQQLDWPGDSYIDSDEAFGLPIIDPDIIGPDDFRQPVSGQDPFALWEIRRTAIDNRYSELQNLVEANGSAQTLVTFFGVPITELEALREAVAQGQEPEAGQAAIANLNLTVESLNRLLELQALVDTTEEAIPEETNELINILIQVEKRESLYDTWRQEEIARGVEFGPQQFWHSLREPVEGTWPPILQSDVPWIDPDLMEIEDLPEPAAGQQAIVLYNDRTTELEQLHEALQAEQENSGFEALLQLALGDPLPQDLDILQENLLGSDPTIIEAAQQDIENNLHMSVEDFNLLMLARSKALSDDPGIEPTPSELDQVYSLLLRTHKVGQLYPQWLTVEAQAGMDVAYWRATKMRLPQWRASTEARQAWQQALTVRSQPPLIDPDRNRHADMKSDQPSWQIMSDRVDWIQDKVNRLRNIQNSATTPREAIETMLTDSAELNMPALGASVDGLLFISEQQNLGESIEPRLRQLNLSKSAFLYLLDIIRQVEANVELVRFQWADVHSIAIRIAKERLAATWRAEEQATGLFLSPSFFQLSVTEPVSYKELRASRQERRDWRDRLTARIEQIKALVNALQKAVSHAEELTLPVLRHFLIVNARFVGLAGAVDRHAAIQNQYLIDTRTDGCFVTTRISQAIETLQGILWQLRTAQLRNDLPDLELVDDYFDEKWKWIGSYASWRAAMFVFLYPENTLQPTLHRRQTPAFRELVDSMRMDQRLTREKACQAAKRYEEYLFDVADLKLDASCQARTSIYADEGCQQPTLDKRRLFYFFARGRVSKKAYWSAYDPEDKSGYAQSFWATIPGLENAKKILGAVPYVGYIWLFAVTKSKGIQQLLVTRFDLHFNRWDDSPQEIQLPENIRSFSAFVAQQSNSSSPPSIFLQSGQRFWAQTIFSDQVVDKLADQEDESNEENGWTEWKPFNVTDGIASQVTNPKRFLLFVVKVRFGFWSIFRHVHDGPSKGHYRGHLLRSNLTYFQEQAIDPTEDLGLIKDVNGLRGIIRLIRNSRETIFMLVAEYSSSDKDKVIVIGDTIDWDDESAASISAGFGIHEAREAGFLGSDKGKIAHHCSDRSDDTEKNLQILPILKSTTSTSGLIVNIRNLFLSSISINLSISSSSPGKILEESSRVQIAPSLFFPLPITESLSEHNLSVRKLVVRGNFDYNKNVPASILEYLKEAYFSVPTYIASNLQKRGEYVAALDWLRTIYDYTAADDRKIYYGLLQEESIEKSFGRSDDWLLDPLNPYAIAAARSNTFTRFTLLSIVQCLLNYADFEYTLDTAESVPRARELYRTALSLLKDELLKPTINECDELIGSIDIEVGEGYQLAYLSAISQLNEFNQPDQLRSIVAEIRAIAELPDVEDAERVSRIATVVSAAKSSLPAAPPVRAVVAQKRNSAFVAQSAVITSSFAYAATRQATRIAEADFNHAVAQASGFTLAELQEGQSLPWLRSRRTEEDPASDRAIITAQVVLPAINQHLGGFKQPEPYIPAPSYSFCIPPNPVVDMLRQRAELNLHKIRTCRNITGLERQIEPYVAPTDTVSGIPSTQEGQLLLPGTSGFRPTAYRYIVLIERAKQLVQLAAQTEAAMLSAIEKQDAELYSLLKARQDIQLAQAGIRLQDLRVREAESGVALVEVQRDRAQLQVDTYQEWINTGTIEAERDLLDAYDALETTRINAARVAMLAEIAGAGVTAASAAATSLPAALFALTTLSFAAEANRRQQENIIRAETTIQIATFNASYERRKQEWEFQKELAQQDVIIGNQQIQLAEDRVDIVEQERRISQMQAQQAAEVLEFLSNKFTNAALYDWMSNVLEGIYSYFLHQATNTAKLAENQLAFERQEVVPAFIQEDYWEAPDENSGIGSLSTGRTPERRGLTGSARLLQDITRLDQYAFETDHRKLHLSTTLSLAQLAPLEFQQFKETGIITFATPMEMFDRQFPGHYLRLVKRIRVSVIALIPPIQGIHATLTAGGNSRVVVQSSGIFQTTIINDGTLRSVALSSPIDATGVFELDQQKEMLLPFENMGVHADWQFEMPKSANYFDYSTLADVLITIEYTALNSSDYRQQVIQQFDPHISGDRPFRFRNEFADAWYDLNNPEQTDTPMVVRFPTSRGDFPPNINDLRIQHLILYFIRKDGETFEVPVRHLQFTEQDTIGAVGGPAQSIDGVISTRRGNGTSWLPMTGKRPFGVWELAFDETPASGVESPLRTLLDESLIEDILFVVTYTGQA